MLKKYVRFETNLSKYMAVKKNPILRKPWI